MAEGFWDSVDLFGGFEGFGGGVGVSCGVWRGSGGFVVVLVLLLPFWFFFDFWLVSCCLWFQIFADFVILIVFCKFFNFN